MSTDTKDEKAEKPEKAAPSKRDAKISEIPSANVLIRRDEVTTVPGTVFGHELPILRELHGFDFVQVVSEDVIEVADFNANDELARLQRKYNTKEFDIVGKVYANDARRVAEEAGVDFKAGDARKPQASEQSPVKKKVIGAKK